MNSLLPWIILLLMSLLLGILILKKRQVIMGKVTCLFTEALSSYLVLLLLFDVIREGFRLWSVIAVILGIALSHVISYLISGERVQLATVLCLVCLDGLALFFFYRLGIKIGETPWYLYLVLFLLSILMSYYHQKRRLADLTNQDLSE